jgi:hypothetical protein
MNPAIQPEPPDWEQFMRCEFPAFRPLLYTVTPRWEDLRPEWREDVIRLMRERGAITQTEHQLPLL